MNISLAFPLKGTNTKHSGHIVHYFFQTELKVEIYAESLVRAIGKYH